MKIRQMKWNKTYCWVFIYFYGFKTTQLELILVIFTWKSTNTSHLLDNSFVYKLFHEFALTFSLVCYGKNSLNISQTITFILMLKYLFRSSSLKNLNPNLEIKPKVFLT